MKSGNHWETAGGVVQGATHIRQNKICQDALYIHENTEGYALVCVADGHGSDRCPFSDEGAKVAVKIAANILVELMNSPDVKNTLAAHKDIRLPRQMEKAWKEAVQYLYTKREGAESIPAFSYELYGTTMLALVAAPDFIFALQIGDGDLVAIQPDGTARWLLPQADNPGNETESLCMEESWKYIRTQLIPVDNAENAPTMFLLSTDGYANSFTTSEGFLKAGADIYRLWNDEGADFIQKNLEAWLAQTSADGSGDDIAVALVFSK